MLTQHVNLHALQSVLNDQGDTGIAGPNSQNFCQLFEIQNNRVPKNSPVFVDFIYFASFRVIYDCQNGYCIREGHSSREREMFVGYLYFISLDCQNDAYETSSKYSSERPAGYSLMSRKRLSEELSEIQGRFLKVFHMVRKHYTLRQNVFSSSDHNHACISGNVCCFNFPGKFITINNLLQKKFNIFHS